MHSTHKESIIIIGAGFVKKNQYSKINGQRNVNLTTQYVAVRTLRFPATMAQ